MKYLYLLIVSIFITSCNRAIIENAKTAKEFYEENKITFKNVSREKLITYPKDIQSMAFSDFNNKKKAEIFKAKFKYVLEKKLFIGKKKEAIEFAYNNTNENIYSNVFDRENFISTLKNKIHEAKFTEMETYLIFQTFENVSIINNNSVQKKLSEGSIIEIDNKTQNNNFHFTREPLPECNQDWSLSCRLIPGYECAEKCEPSSRGCGLLFLSECNKICVFL